jgi:hypothetical protein
MQDDQKHFVRNAAGTGFVRHSAESIQAVLAMPAARRPQVLSAADPEVAVWLLATDRAEAQHRAGALFAQVRSRVAKTPHHLKSARWALQLPAALDLMAHGAAAQPLHRDMLALEARTRQRGETPEQLAAKVVANSTVFAMTGAAVDGVETATMDAIAAATGAPGAVVDAAREALRTELEAIFSGPAGAGAAAMVAALLADD